MVPTPVTACSYNFGSGADDKLPIAQCSHQRSGADAATSRVSPTGQLDGAVPRARLCRRRRLSARRIPFAHPDEKLPSGAMPPAGPRPSDNQDDEEGQRIMKTIVVGLVGLLITVPSLVDRPPPGRTRAPTAVHPAWRFLESQWRPARLRWRRFLERSGERGGTASGGGGSSTAHGAYGAARSTRPARARPRLTPTATPRTHARGRGQDDRDQSVRPRSPFVPPPAVCVALHAILVVRRSWIRIPWRDTPIAIGVARGRPLPGGGAWRCRPTKVGRASSAPTPWHVSRCRRRR